MEKRIFVQKKFVRPKLLLTLHFDLNVYKEFLTCLVIACECSVRRRLQRVFYQLLGSPF